MKEKNITPKVIELSKRIAELGEPELYIGCWCWSKKSGVFLIKDCPKNWLNPNIIPIPSISDCLEKLRELDIESFGTIYQNKETTLHPLWDYIKGSCSIQRLHEALLFALLKVLRG